MNFFLLIGILILDETNNYNEGDHYGSSNRPGHDGSPRFYPNKLSDSGRDIDDQTENIRTGTDHEKFETSNNDQETSSYGGESSNYGGESESYGGESFDADTGAGGSDY